MRKISDLQSENFYVINNCFDIARDRVYNKPFMVFFMAVVNIMLTIAYGQIYGSERSNHLPLKVFFVFMIFLLVVQWVLSICLYINMKLKKKSKILFSIYYFVILMSIMLTFCLCSLANTAYVNYDDYFIILSILAFILGFVFFIICVVKERKKIIEGYYLKENKNKNEIADGRKYLLYLVIAIIPILPMFSRDYSHSGKSLSNIFGERYVLFAVNYLSILIFIVAGIFLAKEIFYIYYNFKFKEENLED